MKVQKLKGRQVQKQSTKYEKEPQSEKENLRRKLQTGRTRAKQIKTLAKVKQEGNNFRIMKFTKVRYYRRMRQ